MSRTTFKNASGLPNSRQISTARDLATLGRRLASDFPQYYHYFSTHSFTWNGRKYHGHNSVAETYPGAEGLKTGYTRMSGFNLATSATRDGNRLVAVVMGGKSVRSRDTHMRELLDASYSAIAGNPMLIASAPQKPSPRLKPTLLARLEAERATPTIADSDAIRRQLMIAASEFTPAADPASDAISSLIAAANPEELNAAERTRLADVSPMEALWGEGDAEAGPTPNGWSVQIGAYSTKTLAEDELDAAADAVSLTNRIRVIEPMTLADGSELYRARFTMLTAPEATDLCQSLRDKALSCFVIQDGAAGAQ
jgi:D-alanyl-D-alanine carboxypeptidase